MTPPHIAAVQLHILRFVLADRNKGVVVVFVITATWVGISKVIKGLWCTDFLIKIWYRYLGIVQFQVSGCETCGWKFCAGLFFFSKCFISLPTFLHFFTIFPHSHVFMCHRCFRKKAVLREDLILYTYINPNTELSLRYKKNTCKCKFSFLFPWGNFANFVPSDLLYLQKLWLMFCQFCFLCFQVSSFGAGIIF